MAAQEQVMQTLEVVEAKLNKAIEDFAPPAVKGALPTPLSDRLYSTEALVPSLTATRPNDSPRCHPHPRTSPVYVFRATDQASGCPPSFEAGEPVVFKKKDIQASDLHDSAAPFWDELLPRKCAAVPRTGRRTNRL